MGGFLLLLVPGGLLTCVCEVPGGLLICVCVYVHVCYTHTHTHAHTSRKLLFKIPVWFLCPSSTFTEADCAYFKNKIRADLKNQKQGLKQLSLI